MCWWSGRAGNVLGGSKKGVGCLVGFLWLLNEAGDVLVFR